MLLVIYVCVLHAKYVFNKVLSFFMVTPVLFSL